MQDMKSDNYNERILELKPIEGKKVLSSIGTSDPRLFTGEVEVKAVRDLTTMLWRVKYSAGNVPPAFRQHFTTLNKLLDYVKVYYKNRNIEVTLKDA